ncbi:replication initiation protein [Rubrivirga marina]|uniref:Initiator Rep protein WH1 domain-containing protein n=1 Tax=Rubrivirga marina TaxID=1196024 RepID=A0A271ISM8_9BACT|nr:replication initiation protein [Rubrivirga marina]PAP74160.1 hypothetical protein BSZ37_21075 [Rubrivirga marina]
MPRTDPARTLTVRPRPRLPQTTTRAIQTSLLLGIDDPAPPAVEVKKHVGAVHAKAPLSLLQRKVANVLLLNAFEELADDGVERHEIALRDLARICGFDSNNWEYLQDALRALTDVRIEWNVLDEKGKKRWGRSAYLAEVEMVERSGTASYVYPPTLRRQLADPAVYARINLAIQARFGSGYALALYENCVRFRKVGTTGWISLDDWRGLLGVEDGQYAEYKYLNKQVLKRAAAEVNEFSDIRVEMETRKEGRSVVALRFTVAEAPDDDALRASGAVGPAIREALGAVPDPRDLAPEPADVIADHPLADLQRRLLTFGLTEAQALDLSTEFDADRVVRNLDHVEHEVARSKKGRGEVKNVAAFTVAAVRGDYAAASGPPPVVQRAQEKEVQAERAQADERRQRQAEKAQRARAERESVEARAEALDEAFGALPEAERDALTARAVARLADEAPQVHAWYREEVEAGLGEDAMRPAVRSTLRAFRRDLLAEDTAD